MGLISQRNSSRKEAPLLSLQKQSGRETLLEKKPTSRSVWASFRDNILGILAEKTDNRKTKMDNGLWFMVFIIYILAGFSHFVDPLSCKHRIGRAVPFTDVSFCQYNFCL